MLWVVLIGNGRSWIGITDGAQKGTLRWVDSSPSFIHLLPGQPDGGVVRTVCTCTFQATDKIHAPLHIPIYASGQQVIITIVSIAFVLVCVI